MAIACCRHRAFASSGRSVAPATLHGRSADKNDMERRDARCADADAASGLPSAVSMTNEMSRDKTYTLALRFDRTRLKRTSRQPTRARARACGEQVAKKGDYRFAAPKPRFSPLRSRETAANDIMVRSTGDGSRLITEGKLY